VAPQILVARVGEDEFGAACAQVDQLDHAAGAARKLLSVDRELPFPREPRWTHDLCVAVRLDVGRLARLAEADAETAANAQVDLREVDDVIVAGQVPTAKLGRIGPGARSARRKCA
jgi:hypothetical protein